ncbi:MAG: phospholipase D-like domain-containing protein [Sandaracinaceae bacterium]
MRRREENGPFAVNVTIGAYTALLGWDVDAAHWKTFTKDLLGFAIERTELKGTTVVERYWLRGMKRFEDKDQGSPVGSPFPLSEHPVQSFQWGDYTVKPRTTYRYRVVPVRGKPKMLDLRDDQAVEVEIQSEREDDANHGIWFNRGVAGSQAYARRFGTQRPDQDAPDSDQMKWLSRNLYESLIDFIGRAKDQSWGLRAALYEFRYAPVVRAFADAIDRGVDVEILYDGPNYGDENEAAIADAGIGANCRPRNGNKSNKHNKFIVLTKNGVPHAVWTGSTNISAGGIFGHSNVGHLVSSKPVAKQYLDYWDVLSSDPDAANGAIRSPIILATPTPSAPPHGPPAGISVMFSPRQGATLDFYRDVFASASSLVCFTVAFTVNKAFEAALQAQNDTLRYILKDKPASDPAGDVYPDNDVVVAAGSKLEKGDLEGFLGESLTGFNRNLYIHDKFMLVDPLSDDPVVVTGSANFSTASMSSNDENMLVIRGDTRVADIYLGEFMRIFDHLYARFIVRRAKLQGWHSPQNFLKPDDGWVKSHAGTTSRKAKRRRVFARTP